MSNPFGLIYAGAQKNIGPAGVCVVIIREDMLKRTPQKNMPTMLKYTTHASKNSMYNTPPCFGVYTIQLVMKWLEETIGGLEAMDAINRKKAACLFVHEIIKRVCFFPVPYIHFFKPANGFFQPFQHQLDGINTKTRRGVVHGVFFCIGCVFQHGGDVFWACA